MTNSIEQQGSSLLLDMAEIWESFLRNHIGAILATDDFGNWTTVPQTECATQVYGSQFYHREIIPDLLFQREYEGKTQYIVLDAKYKRMKGQKADVDRGDFFQIHSYIQYYASLKNAEVVLGGLLYPLESLDVDKHNWQASSLFDLTEGNTQFVVDGIFLNDIPSNSDSPETISLVLHQRIEQMVKAWNIHG
jgi:5-methylcytosine-specific restriction endonuclease McrBC regulatory subunit McrC